MGDRPSGTRPAHRGGTLNSLKEELHSLNMRLLLAMQNHDQEAQEDIQAQMTTVRAEMDRMCLGSGRRG